MGNLPPIDNGYLLDFLTDLLNTPSPAGYTEQAVAFVEKELRSFPGLKLDHTRKGALVVNWAGENDDAPRALTAHIDTLGAMVKEIKGNGRLKLSRLGGFSWHSVEGEGCTIFTRQDESIRGSILLNKASGHVYGKAFSETKRDNDSMEVRLDVRTNSAAETRKLGIEEGNFVAFDPRVEIVNGFIRSRHLDDKACIAAYVAAVKALTKAGMRPVQTTTMLVSNFEEVGHGAAAGIPSEAIELVTLDMAAVGEGQTSDEFHATICVKDANGPYHHRLSQRLRQIAEAYEIPYKVDIYPNYGSDGQALWRSGGDLAVALIGPGVDASHNYERTHTEAVVATANWIMAYLLS